MVFHWLCWRQLLVFWIPLPLFHALVSKLNIHLCRHPPVDHHIMPEQRVDIVEGAVNHCLSLQELLTSEPEWEAFIYPVSLLLMAYNMSLPLGESTIFVPFHRPHSTFKVRTAVQGSLPRWSLQSRHLSSKTFYVWLQNVCRRGSYFYEQFFFWFMLRGSLCWATRHGSWGEWWVFDSRFFRSPTSCWARFPRGRPMRRELCISILWCGGIGDGKLW